MNTDAQNYRIFKLIEAKPHISQRELAQEMGVSLGKAHYCLQALVQKGLLKMDNFWHNEDKRVYAYLLTPIGFKAKAQVTARFLKARLVEYKAIKAEIEELRREVIKDTLE